METTAKINLTIRPSLFIAASIKNTAANKTQIFSIKNNPINVKTENPNIGRVISNDNINSAPK